MKRRMISKRVLSCMTAAVMAASGSTAVWAGSYQENEKAVLDSFVESSLEQWDESLAESQEVKNSAKLSLNLELGESVQYILYFLAGMDFSWLNSAGLDMKMAVEGENVGIDLGVLVNDSKVLTLLEYVDWNSLMAYMQVPEIYAGTVQVPMEVEGSVTTMDGTTEELPSEAVGEMMAALSDPSVYLPDETQLKDILNRYKDIVLAHITEGTSSEETLETFGVTQDCTMYEGRVYEADAQVMEQEILTTAREDQQLKEVIDAIGEAGQQSDLYAQFLNSIDEALASLETEMAEGSLDAETYIFSRLWQDETGRVAGRQFGILEGGAESVLVNWRSLKQGDTSAMRFEFADGTNSFGLEGSGTTTDGALDGEYRLLVDGESLVQIHVEDYRVDEDGSLLGTYTLKLDSVMSDEETYALLGAYSLTIAFEGTADDQKIVLTVNQDDLMLATLTITVTNGGGDGAGLQETSEPLMDLETDEGMTMFMENIDWTPLMDNLNAAGMPEEVVQYMEQALISALSGEETDAADSYADGYSEGENYSLDAYNDTFGAENDGSLEAPEAAAEP